MPKIFEYLAFIIRFYTNDHLPVYVQIQEREMKVEFVLEQDTVTLLFKKVKQKEPLTQKKLRKFLYF